MYNKGLITSAGGNVETEAISSRTEVFQSGRRGLLVEARWMEVGEKNNRPFISYCWYVPIPVSGPILCSCTCTHKTTTAPDTTTATWRPLDSWAGRRHEAEEEQQCQQFVAKTRKLYKKQKKLALTIIIYHAQAIQRIKSRDSTGTSTPII